jgi:protein-S-isoprenylcysteine O-methyltransferase Ste14
MSAEYHSGAIAAAVLYAWGLVMLVAVRAWRQKKATGGTGFNGFRRASGRASRLAGILFLVAILLGQVSPVLAATRSVDFVGPTDDSTAAVFVWTGVAVAIAGFVAAVAAQNAMGASWRIGVDQAESTDLVTRGLFAHVRNPVFRAMIAAQLGTALMAPTWPSIAAVVLLPTACQLQVRLVEEPYLARTHGSSYTDHAASTGRFLPGLGRLTRRSQPVLSGSEQR